MALIDNRKWEPGHKLTCRFLDGDKSQQDQVITNAKRWEEYADIHIEFGNDPSAEVRISFVCRSRLVVCGWKRLHDRKLFPQERAHHELRLAPR